MSEDSDSTDEVQDVVDATTVQTLPTYKVIGELDAVDGIGVHGHVTAQSGVTYGVEGVTDSDNADAAGVRAEATNGGTALRADASAYTAVEARTDSTDGFGVDGTATGTGSSSFGFVSYAAGIYGIANAGSTTGAYTAGVFGQNRNNHSDAAGVRGTTHFRNSTTSGTTYGVFGLSRTTGTDSAGVYGQTASLSGEVYGVRGRTASVGGDAAGVAGEQTNDSGRGDGVYGRTAGAGEFSAGVKGERGSGGSQGYGVRGENDATGGRGVYGVAGGTNDGSGTNQAIGVLCESTYGWGMYSYDDVFVDGDIEKSGNVNFVEAVDADAGTTLGSRGFDAADVGDHREVVYTCVESPQVRTEVTGKATTSDGSATIALPDHFGWVTDADEPVHVQVTPYEDTGGLKVTDRSPDRIVVEELDGSGSTRFGYTVKGIREGHADDQVVREPEATPVDQSIDRPNRER